MLILSDQRQDEQLDVPVPVVVAHRGHASEHQGRTPSTTAAGFTDVAAAAAAAAEQPATTAAATALQGATVTSRATGPGRTRSITRPPGASGHGRSARTASLAGGRLTSHAVHADARAGPTGDLTVPARTATTGRNVHPITGGYPTAANVRGAATTATVARVRRASIPARTAAVVAASERGPGGPAAAPDEQVEGFTRRDGDRPAVDGTRARESAATKTTARTGDFGVELGDAGRHQVGLDRPGQVERGDGEGRIAARLGDQANQQGR